MEFTYETARLELTAWLHATSRIDLALCRRGGHPDEAWWITDRPLHDALIGVHNAIGRALECIRVREDIQSYRALNEREETAKAETGKKRGRPRKKNKEGKND